MKIFLILINIIIFANASASESILSENAPIDTPQKATEIKEVYEYNKALEPYIKKARATYPQAKTRYSNGLPSGEYFFITTRLHDFTGNFEQVFILVENINNSMISGVIYNDIRSVVGYRKGQKYKFPENEIYDWLITKPDGSEEGNFVGKFLDTYYKKKW